MDAYAMDAYDLRRLLVVSFAVGGYDGIRMDRLVRRLARMVGMDREAMETELRAEAAGLDAADLDAMEGTR